MANLSNLTLQDLTRDKIIDVILGFEGGYGNNKHDSGGATRFGITHITAKQYQHLWPKYNFNGNMRELPLELAREIYVVGFWNKVNGDALFDIHPALALHIFDLAVNSGPAVPGKHFQRLLNVMNRHGKDYQDLVVDGQIGPKTIESLRTFIKRNGKQGLANFILAMGMQQGDFYLRISESSPKNEEFTNGWMNRAAEKMRFFVKVLG